jgi:non-heme chloroperoxidase
VLIHGYPLNGRSWEKQQRVLLDAGHRVLNHDRRGFGNSSQPTIGYDSFAADLNAQIEHLALDDIVLVGFLMGTGEVTRYLGTYGSRRTSKAALLGAIPPFLLKTDDNPEGVDQSVFDGIRAAVVADRPAHFKAFLEAGALQGVPRRLLQRRRPRRVAHQRAGVAGELHVAVAASPYAADACVPTWLTDFRADLPKIDVPTLLVHGDADRILPFDRTAKRLPGLIADLKFVVVGGGPHNIAWTHTEEVNEALLDLLGGQITPRPPAPTRGRRRRALRAERRRTSSSRSRGSGSAR